MSSFIVSDQFGRDGSSYSRIQPWLVCFSAALFFFFEFIQLNMFNAIAPVLAHDFHIDATVLADISDKYFLANIIFLFPAGMLLDRVSTRRAIIIGMLASILCTFAFGASNAVWQMKLARFITGVAGSLCLLSCVRLASRWFPSRQMALVVGLIVTFAMLGGMVAQTPLTLLIKYFGWRTTVIIDATVGIALLLLIILFVKDQPAGRTHNNNEHPALHGIEFFKALGTTLSKKQNWFGGLYTSFMNLPIFLLGAMWGIFYLTQVQHLSNNSASITTSLLFIGVIVGSPAVGWLSDYIQRRKLPMIIGSILSLALILILMFTPNLSAFSLGAIFFGIGFITSTQIITYPLIAESNPLTVTATAEGMASVLIMSGGFTQLFFAYLIQLNWNHQYIDGIPNYSLFDYQVGLSIIPIGFIVSFVLSLFLKETYCQPYKNSGIA